MNLKIFLCRYICHDSLSLSPSLLHSLALLKIYIWGRVCVRASMCVFRMYVCERSCKRVLVRMCAWASAYGRMYVFKCERVYMCLFLDKGWVCLFGCVCVHNCLMHVSSFFADAPLLLHARVLFFPDGPLWVVSRLWPDFELWPGVKVLFWRPIVAL